MHTWTENNGSLTIDYRPGGGCSTYFVPGIFCVMFIFMLPFMLLILLSLDFPFFVNVFFLLFFCIFGILSGIGIFRNLRKDFTLQAMLKIDSQNETINLYNTHTKSDLQLGLGEFDHIQIKKVRVMRENRRTGSYYDYQIFLIKKNWTAFWLDTQYEAQKEPFSKYIDQLTSFVGLEVKDLTEFELDRPATQTYTNIVDTKYTPSKWVVEIRDAKGTIFTLKSKRSITNSLISVLIYSIFIFAPAIMFFTMYRDIDAPLLFDFGALVIGLAYFTVIILLALVQFKRYILRLEQDTLAIRLAFVFSIFDRIFGRLLNIPKDVIQNAGVHRTANGHFWLALGVKSFSAPAADRVLFGMGAFQKQGLDDIKQDESLIGLWEISGLRHNKGTTPQDLSYIADRIQSRYLKNS